MTGRDALLDELQAGLGYRFTDLALLRSATTHKSSPEAESGAYERLAFLGDAVVGLAVAGNIFVTCPDCDKGCLTVIRSTAVERHSQSHAAGRLALTECMLVGPGLAKRQWPTRAIMAEAYEALMGAVYLDGGFAAASEVVLRTLRDELEAAMRDAEHPYNYKAMLQERLQADGKQVPTYRIVEKVGPDHEAQFLIEVSSEGEQKGTGSGRTKKEAEQDAAQAALEKLYPGWEQKRHACSR